MVNNRMRDRICVWYMVEWQYEKAEILMVQNDWGG